MNQQAELKNFTQRMAYVAKLVGNATVLARRTRISRRAIGTYLSGASDPTRERLVAIAEAAGVCVRWLATGEGPVFPSDNEDISPFVQTLITQICEDIEEMPSDVHSKLATAGFPGHRLRKIRAGVVVPSLRELQSLTALLGLDIESMMLRSLADNAAADTCTSVSQPSYVTLPQDATHDALSRCRLCVGRQQECDNISFKHDWVVKELGVDPGKACLMEVQCETMCPTFRPGDMVLISCHDQQQAMVDGIYVVSMGGDAMLKRVQKLPGNKLRISSDNPMFESYTVNLPLDDDTRLLGRVMWSGRRF